MATVGASLAFGAGSWNPNEKQLDRLRRGELRRLRSIVRVRKSEEDSWPSFFEHSAFTIRVILARAGIEGIIRRIRRQHHRWAGHFARADPSSSLAGFAVQHLGAYDWLVFQSLKSHPHNRTGPQRRFDTLLQASLEEHWQDLAQSRDVWRIREDAFVALHSSVQRDPAAEPRHSELAVEPPPSLCHSVPQNIARGVYRTKQRNRAARAVQTIPPAREFSQTARAIQTRNDCTYSQAINASTLRALSSLQPSFLLAIWGDNKAILDYAQGRGRLEDSVGRGWVDEGLEAYGRILGLFHFGVLRGRTSHFQWLARRHNKGADFLCNHCMDGGPERGGLEIWEPRGIRAFGDWVRADVGGRGPPILAVRFDGGRRSHMAAAGAGVCDVVEPRGGGEETGSLPLLLWAEHLSEADSFQAEAWAFRGTLQRLEEWLFNWSASLVRITF